MKPGDVVLLDNLRKFEEEEANDENFAKELASLAEVFVNDGQQVMTNTFYINPSANKISFHSDGSALLNLTKYDLKGDLK